MGQRFLRKITWLDLDWLEDENKNDADHWFYELTKYISDETMKDIHTSFGLTENGKQEEEDRKRRGEKRLCSNVVSQEDQSLVNHSDHSDDMNKDSKPSAKKRQRFEDDESMSSESLGDLSLGIHEGNMDFQDNHSE